MADIHPAVLQNVHSLGFGVRSQPPAALNFGFGMSNTHFTPSSLASLTPTRSNKRRLENDGSDDGMDTRSPTPEAGRRLPIKRLRGAPPGHVESDGRGSKATKTNATSTDPETDDIDIGFMLALLPPQSLVPLISSLLKDNPSLKSNVLSHMPRPSLESALQALSQSSSKLKNALPYSSSGFAFGSSSGSTGVPRIGLFSAPMETPSMRDSYVQSRIAPHLTEFTTNVQSVLPFFSLLPLSFSSRNMSQDLKVHPSETFTYLSAVTRELLSLPPICHTTLRSTLTPRLLNEWKAWLNRVDDHVNNQAGMFGLGTLKIWESELDEFASNTIAAGLGLGDLKQIRDTWIVRLGFLVGRMQPHNRMDDEI